MDGGLLRRMNAAIGHRGPDGDGFLEEPGVGLAQRRLAIIDLSGGKQPMFNADGTVAVVFNGEIYNFQELRLELQALGYVFTTASDTEAIVHGWEAWGPACLDRLNGMFAIALWDRNKRQLFLARDRLGEKPMYWSVLPDGMFAFGSELKALLVHPELRRAIDPQAVEQYFAYGYVPEPLTILKGVHKLEPGHMILLEQGNPSVNPRRYWDVSFDAPIQADEGAVRAELVDRLRDSTRIRMISDVPIGGFLSGGVDSSGVVAMMAGLSPQAVKTFCMSFQQKAFDESAYAEKLARRYATDHHVEQVDATALGPIDDLGGIYDEPFADSSALPTLRVCGLARKHVTVALSGDGADELFAGYRRYLWHSREEQVREWLPHGLRKGVFGTLGAIYPKLDWAPRFLRAKTTFQELARESAEAYFISVADVTDAERSAIFSDSLKRELQGHRAIDVLRTHMDRADTDDALSKVLYADMKTWLSGRMLTKVDRASMAVSLEVRVPMLDHTLVEWATRLPSSLKLNGQERKYILKRALEPHVPSELLYRPKSGFSIPLSDWFRGPLLERIRAAVESSALKESGLFNVAALKERVEAHASGRRDHAQLLWAVWMFESFLRRVNPAI